MQFIRKIVNLGTEGNAYEEANDVRLINVIALVGAFVSLFFSFVMLLQGWKELIAFNFITFLACILALLFNFIKRYLAAIFVVTLVLPIMIFGYVYVFGGLGSEHFLYVGALISLYFFRKYKVLGTLVFVLSGVLFIVSKVLLWKMHHHMEIPDDLVLAFFTNVTFSYLLLYFVVYFFRKSHDKERMRLDKLNTSRGRMISMLSHDMRNPIKNLEALLSGALSNNLPKEDNEKIMGMLAEQLKMTSLTLDNSILWVKGQMDGFEVKKAKFTLDSLINENLMLIKDIANRKSIKVESEVEKGIEVFAEREIFNIVLRNLLSNAIKYTFPGEGVIKIKVLKTKECYWISVEDNGQGITEEKMGELFSQNGSTAGTMNEAGYGVGLRLVHSFLNHINEKIEVDSAKNKGTVFRFTVSR